MLIYPQLNTKALVQYPSSRRARQGSVASVTPGGVWHTWHRAGSQRSEWEVHYSGLTEVEGQRLEAFFQSAQGRRRSFAFVDPTSNLLGWSSDLGHTAWERTPLLSLALGGTDPRGGDAAATIVNGSQLMGGMSQSIPCPATYTYCLSVWLRAHAASMCELMIGDARSPVRVAEHWQRFEASSEAGTSPVSFGVRVPAGNAVSLYGMQAEAQLSASEYIATSGPGGVHASARFDQDSLTLQATGPDDYSTVVRVVSNRQE